MTENGAGNLNGKVELIGWNEQIDAMLTDEQRMYKLALANIDTPQLMAEVAKDPYRAVERMVASRGDLKEGMKALEGARKERIMKLALGTLVDKEDSFLAPTNGMAAEQQSLMLRPDLASQQDIASRARGFDDARIGKGAFHQGRTNQPTGRNVTASLTNPINADPANITLAGGNTTSSLEYTNSLLRKIAIDGITPNVSANQIQKRAFAAGSNLYGPSSVEAYKSLTPFGYHRPATRLERTDHLGNTVLTPYGENAYRYRSRYAAGPRGGGAEIAEAIHRNSGNFQKLGYINFADDEHIMLNARDARYMQIDAPISAGFREYDDVIAAQKIRVQTMTGEYVRDANNKVRVFTFEDMYNAQAAGHQELMGLMTGQTEHRITGLNRGTKLGISDDARPVIGLDDPLGIDVVGGYKVLKNQGYMGNEEFRYFMSSLENRHPDSKVSIAIRTVSNQTKAAVAGTTVRSAVDYVNFAGIRTGDTLEDLMNSLSSLHNGMDNLEDRVVGTFGSKLFKGAIPTAIGKEVMANKGMHELQQFLHSSILGHVADVRYTTSGRVLLTDSLARRFAKMTTNPNVPTKGLGAGIFDLTEFMENGQFILESRNPKAYARDLTTSLDVLGAIRERYENLPANMHGQNIILSEADITGKRSYLSTAWNEIQDAYKAASEGYSGAAPARLGFTTSVHQAEVRKVLWPFLAALSGMENTALSQGAGAFNTAEIGMRDQFMFIGGKEGIYKELLQRNSVDSARLLQEAELLHASAGGTEARATVEARAREYHKYMETIYGKKNKYVNDYLAVLDGKLTPEEMNKNYNDFFRTHGLTIDQARENPEVMAQSFAAESNNPIGKLIRTEDNGLLHIPSAQAMGGITKLPNGNMTFEGKHGGHLSAFWRMGLDIRTSGILPLMTFEGNQMSLIDAARTLESSRAAMKIHDATYAVNIYDRNLVNHDAMLKLEGYTAKAVNKERSIIGSMATISRRDAEVFVEDQLNQVLNKGSNAVIEQLNELRGTWLHQDHGSFIADKINKGFFVDQDNVRGLAKEIVQQRMIHSSNLVSEMHQLNTAFKGGDTATINAQIKKMASMVKKTGMAGAIMRNPVIYEGSLSGMYTFIREDAKFKTLKYHRRSKKRPPGFHEVTNRVQTQKTISAGFELIMNTHGDWDGDKFQYIPLYNVESQKAVEEAIVGIQRETAKFKSVAMKRMKGFRETQNLNLTNKQIENMVKSIFSQKTATTYAGFMTKAFTGSMNIVALATKGMFEKQIRSKKMTQDQIQRVVAWTRTIPSLFTEQQVISSKHLQTIISGSTPGKTKVEHIMDNIGKLKPEEMMDIIKDSSGNVHPVMQMSLAKLEGDIATKGVYAEPIEYANLMGDVQMGIRRYSGEQLDKFKHIIAPHLKKTDKAGWNKIRKSLLELQDKHPPIVEDAAFKAAGFDSDTGWIEILSRGSQEQSNNMNVIMTQVEEDMKNLKLGGTLEAPTSEVFGTINRRSMEYNSLARELFGTSIAGGKAKEARQFRWASKIMPKVDDALNWIKEAPLQRLGGIGLMGLGAIAVSNLLFNDNTPRSLQDIPSRSSNPLMDAKGSVFGHGGVINNGGNLNTNAGLLSDSNMPHINVISSVNSIIGNNGGHSISVRKDNTNPYLANMSYYN
jgi:hypothetical protein